MNPALLTLDLILQHFSFQTPKILKQMGAAIVPDIEISIGESTKQLHIDTWC